MQGVLEKAGHLGMLIDQHFTRGVVVDFLGRPAVTNPILASSPAGSIARCTGSGSSGCRITASPAIDPRPSTCRATSMGRINVQRDAGHDPVVEAGCASTRTMALDASAVAESCPYSDQEAVTAGAGGLLAQGNVSIPPARIGVRWPHESTS
jgi:hypothetical protein